MRTALVVVLLGAGVLVHLLCVAGILAARESFDRLHFTGPSALGVSAIGLAVIVAEGLSAVGVKVALITVALLVINPVITHATARAARVRQFGHWAAMPEDRVE